MDINELQKRHDLKYKNHLIKEQIRKQIKTRLDEKESRQYERKELFKPVIKAQQEVKQTIDEKQDKLIKNINEKQEKLVDAIDNLNDTLSLTGSQVGVTNWLQGQPSILEEEEIDDEPVNTKNVISKYGFDPDLNDIPDLKLVRKQIQILNGMTRNNDIDIAREALQDRIVLSNYLKSIKDQVKSGKGIRNYKQTKRNSYKVMNDKYGSLLINVPKMMNEMVIEAVKDGEIVYRDNADKSLIDLITKRFDHKKSIHQKQSKFSTI